MAYTVDVVGFSEVMQKMLDILGFIRYNKNVAGFALRI
jgi:hypothetical protein